MAKQSKITVAAFDFDGTLTYRDSLLSFFLFVSGPFRTFLNLIIETPLFILYLFGYKTRQDVKESLLKRFFKGKQRQELQKWGREFAQNKIKELLRPNAQNRIDWHKKQGHQCILVSANLDLYLEPWGPLVGFDNIIASRVEFANDGLTGKLVGLNCRGLEKVRRLTEIMGPKEDYFLYAYGDSAGDLELLEFADLSFYQKLE